MTKHAGMRESGYIEHDRAPARSARWSKAESSGTAQGMKQSGIERHGARDEAKRNRAARRKGWSKAESSGTAQEMKQSESSGTAQEMKQSAIELHTASSGCPVVKQ